MNTLRLVYRNPIVETILLTVVFIQIISGIKMFLSKRKSIHGFYGKLQIWTGLYLAFFLFIHVGAILVGRYVLKLDTNFYFGVAGLNSFPVNLFFIPYYSLAIVSFFGHISSIHAQKMKSEVFGVSPSRQAATILIFGAMLSIAILYGLTNGFNGVEIPDAYNILIGK